MKIPLVKVIGLTAPDARGWIGFGCYSLTVMIFAMILWDRKLLESDAFLILATAVVITGWVQGPVGWAYQATKQGNEQAQANSRIVENNAASLANAPTGSLKDPIHTEINQKPENPVPVKPQGGEDLDN